MSVSHLDFEPLWPLHAVQSSNIQESITFFNAQAIVCKVAYLTSHKQTSSNQLFSNQAKSNRQNVTSPACHRIAWNLISTLPFARLLLCYHCRSTSADLLRVYNTLFKRWGHLTSCLQQTYCVKRNAVGTTDLLT